MISLYKIPERGWGEEVSLLVFGNERDLFHLEIPPQLPGSWKCELIQKDIWFPQNLNGMVLSRTQECFSCYRIWHTEQEVDKALRKTAERKLLLRKGNTYTLQAKWSHCIFCSLQPQIFIKGIKKSHQAAEKTKRDIHVLEPAFSIIKYHRGWWRSGAASLRITTNLEAKLVRNARSMWKRTNLLSHWH